MRASLFFGSFVAVAVVLAGVEPAVARASVRGDAPADAIATGPEVDPRFAIELGAFETAFAFDEDHAGRAHNVALAASHLDGAVIEPGEVLSFNEVVGPRTLAAGFEHAPELHDGHLHEGVGGGVCQVATTLHVASRLAGLEIVEHRAHSIPLHYADPGLDATVSYGRIDFRVRNPHAFPVRVRASAIEGALVIRLEGAEAVSAARIETRVIRTLERGERVVTDASLGSGAREIEDRGRDGMVVRVRVVREDGTRSETLVRYASAPRVVRAGG